MQEYKELCENKHKLPKKKNKLIQWCDREGSNSDFESKGKNCVAFMKTIKKQFFNHNFKKSMGKKEKK